MGARGGISQEERRYAFLLGLLFVAKRVQVFDQTDYCSACLDPTPLCSFCRILCKILLAIYYPVEIR